jgi:hypothetical protein
LVFTFEGLYRSLFPCFFLDFVPSISWKLYRANKSFKFCLQFLIISQDWTETRRQLQSIWLTNWCFRNCEQNIQINQRIQNVPNGKSVELFPMNS